MKTKVLLTLVMLIPLLLPGSAHGRRYPDGFNSYSSVLSGSGIPQAGIRVVAVQPWDGKVVVGGNFRVERDDIVQQNLARIKTDGTFDPDFTASASDTVKAIAIGADRSIFIGGSFSAVSSGAAGSVTEQDRYALARLESDKGAVHPFTGRLPEGSAVNTIVIHPDGSILVGGSFNRPATALDPLCRNLARISATDGAFITCFSGGLTGGEVNAIALQDGRVVAGGSFTSPRSRLARYLPEGGLDESFPLTVDGTVRAFGAQADGKVILGGDFTSLNGSERSRVARFDRLSLVDEQFQPPLLDGGVRAIAVQPDGRILIGGAFSERLIRVEMSGVKDATVAPGLDGPVHALALQPDEKFLAGGEFSASNGRVRTMLARFYPYGTLDDDVRVPKLETLWDETSCVIGISLVPDGSLLIGGRMDKVDGVINYGYARLNPDWTLASEEKRTLYPTNTVNFFSPRPDGKITLGGNYPKIDLAETVYEPGGHQLMPDGSVDVDFSNNLQQLLGLPQDGIMWSRLMGAHHTPDGFSYLYGLQRAKDGTIRYVTKINEKGELVPFAAEQVNDLGEQVLSMAVLPDKVVGYKLLAAVRGNGEIVRMLPSGAPDDSWVVPTMTVPDWTFSLTQQGDGKILATGLFISEYSKEGKTWSRQVVRLHNNTPGVPDGTIDDTFLIGLWDEGGANYTFLENAYELSDGTIIVVGNFTHVMDSSGVRYARSGVAVFDNNGYLQPYDFGYFYYGTTFPSDNLYGAEVQPDGKVIIHGGFQSIDGDPAQAHLIRASVGFWATKELEIAADGRSVTWRRGGVGPQWWRVTFMYSPDGLSWKVLGEAERSGNDWHLGGLDLAAEAGGYYRTGYIRAVGYIGGRPGSGDLEISTKAHFTKPVVKVRAVPVQRQMGDPNGDFQPQYRFLDDSPAPQTELYGAAAFSTSAAVDSPVGDYGITADVRNLFSPLYTFVPEESVLSVLPAGPKQDQVIEFTISNKSYGAADFTPDARVNTSLPLSYSSSNTEVATIVNGKIHIKKVGSTRITASQAGNGAYNSASVSRDFEVLRAPIEVRADPKARAFRTPNPALTVTYSGFVYNENSSVISGVPLLSTTAELQSPVADYPITVDVSGMTAVNYSFVPRDGTLSVVKSCQEIIFPQPGDRTYGDSPFQLVAYSCSGLPITFTCSDTRVAKVAGSLVTITGAGSALITASQKGSVDLEGAPDVARTLTVHKGGQEIVFPALPRRMVGDAPLPLTAIASSGLPVSYQSSELSVASISGRSAEAVGPGTAVITAIQEGSPNYNAAIPVSQPLIVAAEGEPPLLSLSTLTTGAVTADPVLNVAGTASDPSGIAGVSIDGIQVADPASPFSSAVALTGGENRIEVSASDGAGNKAHRELTVTFDAAAPYIDVSAPADNSVADAPFFTVSGTVSAGSAVTLAVNGASPQPLPVSGGSFTGNGYLRNGVNTLVVSAELAGRSSSVKRSVTLAPGRPHAAITDPPRDIRTEKGTLLLRGAAGAVGSEVTLQLDVDGTSYAPALQGGTFQQAVALAQNGQHRITATVTDRSGNSSVARRNVIKMERVPGDLDGDALVDLRDALALLRISLGIDAATPQALEHGDVAPLVNGASRPDGRIDVGDVLLVLRKVVGLVEF